MSKMTNTYKCPKCDYSSDTAFEECPKCGIIIKKFIGAQKRQEKQKKIEELEKKIKRTKSGLFKKQKSKKVAIIACTFALILFCGYGIKSYLLASEKDYLKRGNSKCENGEYTLAITEYSEAINIEPNYAAAYCNRGFAYFTLEKYYPAIEDFTKAINLDLKGAGAYNGRAAVFSAIAKFPEAIQDLTSAIHRDPKYALAYANRGKLYGVLGEYQKAESDYRMATQLKPENKKDYEKDINELYYTARSEKQREKQRLRAKQEQHIRELSNRVVKSKSVSELKVQRQMNEINERIKQQQADQNRRYEQLQREAERQKEYNRRATEDALRRERQRRKNDEWNERVRKAADWDWKHAGDDPRYKKNPYR